MYLSFFVGVHLDPESPCTCLNIWNLVVDNESYELVKGKTGKRRMGVGRTRRG